MALLWMLRHTTEAKLSAQKECECMYKRGISVEKGDMWMLSSALTSIWQEKQKQGWMEWKYWLAIFRAGTMQGKNTSYMCAKDPFLRLKGKSWAKGEVQ